MIKYSGNTINDWNFGDDNIIKVYRNNAVCYYKITGGGDTPTAQTPCFAVVQDITQYSDTEFEDVFNLADEKWYKLNNLNQYEEYGIYGSGRTITTYEGKLTIDEETSSRLPDGYTEVEYIENTSTAYVNLDAYIYDSSDTSYSIETKLSSTYHRNEFEYLFATEGTTSPYNGMGYRWNRHTNNSLEFFNVPSNAVFSSVDNGDGTSGVTVTCTSASSTNNVPLSLFCGIWSSGPWRYGYGKIYNFKLTKNSTLIRDLVPAKRDSDSKYGMYDIVNDVFYLSPNNVNFSGGEPIAPTKTYEYIYSGGSWVNLGEVSGSTIQTVWYDPPASGSNARFDIGHYWGENYKMVFTTYLQGSFSSDVGSFWQSENKSPIEYQFYSNGYYYDMHNPTSTSSPSVHTGDYSYRIMRNNSLRNYENGQVMDITLTYGSVKIELVDSGTVIENTGSTRTGFNWYNGLYLPSIQLGSNHPCHLSRIQVYNASNELVNDLKFVKNNGVTGSQEISMYDSVLNVTYNNTNSNTPTYHVVEESGGTEYPIYYDEIQDPPNNIIFSSMAEAEAYECPWVGMKATIDGDNYIFSGDSQSGYEWVYNPSRLPAGYTEVEYITSENVSESVLGPYIDTNYKPTQNTRIVIDFQSTSSTREYPRIFGSGEFDMLGYIVNLEGVISNRKYYYKFGQTSTWYTTNVRADLNRHTIDYNNSRQFLLDNTSIATLPNNTFTCTSNLGIFWSINTKYTTNNINLIGRVYSCQVYDNGTLVRDLVPCINPSSVVGMYDIVNDVFYSSANNYNFTAGNPI